MNAIPAPLAALLARFDDESYVALANRGLVRRARKDLEQQGITLLESGASEVLVGFGAQRIRFDQRGPAQAQCDCATSGVCQHILAAAMGLQQLATDAAPASSEPEADACIAAQADALAPLRESLLALTSTELVRHAGKAGYRWAWQYVQDLATEQALVLDGSQHLVLELQRPRLTLRYMGGGLDALVADSALAQMEKYRVAAVLAFQQAHGQALTPPEPIARARPQALDLGKDHALAEPPGASLDDTRTRLRTALRRLLAESVELGLAHLSHGIHERYATLAVWAQGAEYHRLALLTRRIADHVDLLLERAAGADEMRLLDEISLAHGLVCALDAAAARGTAPAHLLGQARSRYEASAALELLGLGAQAWRSPAGYVGLTLIFWSPAKQAFMSCTDARPQQQRGFNPVARYLAAGPWSGLGAPAQATGSRIVLQGAQLNDTDRLSAADSASATVQPLDGAALIQQLRPWDCWATLASARAQGQASLLSPPDPMKDWVALKPAQFGAARYDATRQTLVWPLIDAQGQMLFAEIAFGDYSRHAIARIEALTPSELAPGTLVIARLRAGLIAEPLSLVRANAHGKCVDALYFDAAPQHGKPSALLDRLKRMVAPQDAPHLSPAAPWSAPAALRALRHALQRHAERGLTAQGAEQARAEFQRHAQHLGDAGLGAFGAVLGTQTAASEGLLRANYLSLQYERLLGSEYAQAV